MGAGFGLPPGVDDGAAGVAHHLVIPVPGLRIDRLAHRAQQAQAGAGTAGDRLVAHRVQGANGRGRGVKGVYLVLVDHFPAAPRVRVGGHALENQRGGAVGKGAVDDIGVTGDPADIRGAPVDLALAVIEDILERHGGLQQVAPGGMQHTLGLAGGAGGVKNEQRVLRVHGLRRAVAGGAGGGLVVPDVPPFLPAGVAAGAPYDQAGMHIGTGLQGGVGVEFQGDVPAAANAFVGGDQGLAIRVEDTVLQGFRGKAAKDYRVHRPDAGAGQHGVGGLGNHGHVDTDTVALAHPALLEHVGQFADVFLQFRIGDVLAGGGIVALPDEGGLAGSLRQVPVDAVVADIELAAREPGGLTLDEIEINHFIPGFVPAEECLGLLRPEAVRVLDGTLVHGLVLLGVDMGVLEICGYRVGRKFRHGGRSLCLSMVKGDDTAPTRQCKPTKV